VRIAVVGPTHPLKGGVAAHTTACAHHLAQAGHDVVLISWRRLYPRRLYPGEQGVPGGVPDDEPYPRTSHPLSWDRPWTWTATGRRLRGADLLVLPLVVPAQVPALLTITRAARVGGRARVAVIAHNVEPHETHPGARVLVRALLRTADVVITHSAAMAEQARALGARQVRSAELPPHPPGGVPPFVRRHGRVGERLAVLALGLVREYKGVDVLLRAAAEVPDVAICVAGEAWGRAGEEVRRIAAEPMLAGRVELLDGYVAGADVPALLGRHDLLALTYRSATASQNVDLARAHGLPVLASSVGTFADQVRDGVDGVLVPPDDVAAVVAALRRLCEPSQLERLQAGVRPVDVEGPWSRYVAALTRAPEDGGGSEPSDE